MKRVVDEVLWDDLCDDEVLCHHSRGETRILQEIFSDRCVTRKVVIDRVWVHNDADVSVNVLTENITQPQKTDIHLCRINVTIVVFDLLSLGVIRRTRCAA